YIKIIDGAAIKSSIEEDETGQLQWVFRPSSDFRLLLLLKLRLNYALSFFDAANAIGNISTLLRSSRSRCVGLIGRCQMLLKSLQDQTKLSYLFAGLRQFLAGCPQILAQLRNL